MPVIPHEQLLAATNHFLNALANNTHPITLLGYFSTSSLISIQHYPATCPHPQASTLRGPNAVRSYFDLIATHWTRSGIRLHSTSTDPAARKVTLDASIVWTWRKSGRSWTEDFICTIIFDDILKIVSFTVKTVSGPGTCIMRAKDVDVRVLDPTVWTV